MKTRYFIMIMGIVGVAVLAFNFHPVFGPPHASACNWGKAGGGDYVPQQKIGPQANAPSLSKEQAYDVAANYIRRTSPGREVGEVRDAGAFYEIDILDSDRQVVDRLAIDKRTGRMMTII